VSTWRLGLSSSNVCSQSEPERPKDRRILEAHAQGPSIDTSELTGSDITSQSRVASAIVAVLVVIVIVWGLRYRLVASLGQSWKRHTAIIRRIESESFIISQDPGHQFAYPHKVSRFQQLGG